MIGCQLVVLRARLWINPSGDAHALQCVTRARRGGRCRDRSGTGRCSASTKSSSGRPGYVHAYGAHCRYDRVDVDRWLHPHCAVHDTPDTVDHEPAELRRFDIIRDAASIQPHRTDVTFDGVPAPC